MPATFGGNGYRSEAELAQWHLRAAAETILYPDQPIIDAHHHLSLNASGRYLIDEFAADANSGHRVVASVFVQGETMYRADGPAIERPVGETEFAAGQAAMSDSGHFGAIRVALGITAFADIGQGERIGPVLDQHIAVAGGRLRSIRCSTVWDAALRRGPNVWASPQHALLDATYRQGIAAVAARGLMFDAWVYHPQLGDVADLADHFPDLTIVIAHCGGIIGVGPYEGQRDAVFADWSRGLAELARRPNVMLKLGGLGMVRCGFNLHLRDTPADSRELADLWRPYIERSLELFGPSRCMFESNFPVDRQGCGYVALWNAFKTVTAEQTHETRDALFYDTARRLYRLDLPSAATVRAGTTKKENA